MRSLRVAALGLGVAGFGSSAVAAGSGTGPGALASVAARAGAPQEAVSDRDVLRGVVRDRDGHAVVGADVEAWLRPQDHFHPLGSPVAFGGGNGMLDHLWATTDDRGGFRLEVLRGHCYSVAASWRGETGKRSVTRVYDAATAGERLRLVEVDPPPSVRLRVESIPIAFRHEPMRLTVYLDGQNPLPVFDTELDLEAHVGTDMTAEMPYDTEIGAFVAVLSHARGVLQTGAASLRASSPYVRQRRVSTVETNVHVVDADGSPLDGVTLETFGVRNAGAWFAGKTDGHGRASLVFPVSSDSSWLLRARKPGFVEAAFYRIDRAYYGSEQVAGTLPSVIELKLRPARGPFQLRGFDGKPVVGASVVFARRPQGHAANRALFHGSIVDLATSDVSGSLGLEHLGTQFQLDPLRILLPPAAMSPLEASLGGYPMPGADLLMTAPEDRIVDLSRLHLLKLHVALPDGRPARGAECHRQSDLDKTPGVLSLANVASVASVNRTDRRGRVAVLSNARDSYYVIQRGEGWAATPTYTEIIETSQRGEPFDVRLEAFARRAFRILDTSGKPVAGVRARIVGTTVRAVMGNDRRFANSVNRQGLAGTTDDQGMMSLWWIDDPSVEYQLEFALGRRRVRRKLEHVQPGKSSAIEVVDIELR
ncbi:MAG: hypothetical protein KDC95_01515 [Planctomycetes bacterium]|nr:hypothetical protein [Planctomycetota bacterium]